MPTYMLLLREPPAAANSLSPEEMQAIILRYKNWSMKLASQGKLAGGQKLRDGEGRMISANGGKLHVTHGPFTEVKEVIGGFFILAADNYEEAVSLAGDCPHLDFGPIEVREVEPT